MITRTNIKLTDVFNTSAFIRISHVTYLFSYTEHYQCVTFFFFPHSVCLYMHTFREISPVFGANLGDFAAQKCHNQVSVMSELGSC